MALELLNGPASEPISLAEAKAHLRVDSSDEDDLISSLITTSRLQVEAALGLALITQQWVQRADCWPLSGVVELSLRPLISVDEVRVLDAEGTATALDDISYAVDKNGDRPRLTSRTGYWPLPGARLNGIEIDFTAGFGTTAATVPNDVCRALLGLVAHWFEHRGADALRTPPPIPKSVSALLMPYRPVRL
ncbi:MAG: head-tail connector protein [Pseudomonadota bacterium]